MCELIGMYMLSLIASKLYDEVGLYHDNGLAVCKAIHEAEQKTIVHPPTEQPPPALLKHIPLNIDKRLTDILPSREIFEESIPPYQQALKESGYDHKLTYNPEPTPRNKREKGTLHGTIQ